MYSHHLTNMANRLIEKGLLDPKKIQPAIEAMNLEWRDQMAVSWSIGDVYKVADELNITLDSNQAREVLDDLLSSHDAEQGINWIVIETTLSQHDFGN